MAKELRISDTSYHSWENDLNEPMIRFMPRIIEWLGYDPHPPPKNSSEWLMAVRRNLGLSRKGLAKTLGADEASVHRWEESIGVPIWRIGAIRKLYRI